MLLGIIRPRPAVGWRLCGGALHVHAGRGPRPCRTAGRPLAGRAAGDHGDGPVPVRVDRRPADLPGRSRRRVRPRGRQQEEGRIRHRAVDRPRRRLRHPAAVHERAAGHGPALVAGRAAPGLPARGREGRQAPAAADPPDGAGGRRGEGDHGPAQGRERAGVVARRPHPRLDEHDQREGPRRPREGKAPRRRGRAGERRARDHARRLSLERQRLRRLRAAVPRVDGWRARGRRHGAVAAPGHERPLRGGRAGLVRGRDADTVHLDPRRRALLRGVRRGLVRGGRGRWRARAGDEHRRVHQRSGAVAGRPAYRVPRDPQRKAASVVHPARPVRHRRSRRAAAEPDRGTRLRRDDRPGRRSAGAARRGESAHRLGEGRPQRALRRRRAGTLEHADAST